MESKCTTMKLVNFASISNVIANTAFTYTYSFMYRTGITFIIIYNMFIFSTDR